MVFIVYELIDIDIDDTSSTVKTVQLYNSLESAIADIIIRDSGITDIQNSDAYQKCYKNKSWDFSDSNLELLQELYNSCQRIPFYIFLISEFNIYDSIQLKNEVPKYMVLFPEIGLFEMPLSKFGYCTENYNSKDESEYIEYADMLKSIISGEIDGNDIKLILEATDIPLLQSLKDFFEK